MGRQADLLGDLADHRGLGRLTRLDEAGQGRERALGPTGLATQQGVALVVDEQGDDGRVGARVVLGAVRGAGPPPAQPGHVGRRAAPRAAGVGAVPVGQGEELGEDSALVLGQAQADVAQARPLRRRGARPGRRGRQRGRTRPVRWDRRRGGCRGRGRGCVGAGAVSVVGGVAIGAVGEGARGTASRPAVRGSQRGRGSAPATVARRADRSAPRVTATSPVGSSRTSMRSPGTADQPTVRRSARRSSGSWPRARCTWSSGGPADMGSP